MDFARLAQLHKFASVPEKTSEILKRVDVAYCVPENFYIPEAGYNCIHFSVANNALELTQELLKLGADYLKQGVYEKNTPLLFFIKERPYLKFKHVFELIGKLGREPIVDLLLSEQVKKNNPLNPKCKQGMSHLHIACMVDHVQAVELFLKAGEPLNQAINQQSTAYIGYTPLHFAVAYSSVAAAKLLFEYGADIHLKDARGISALHLLIQRILDLKDLMNLGKREICTPIVREIERLEIITEYLLISRKNDLYFVDDLGYSALHVACTLRNLCFLKKLLDGSIDINGQVSIKARNVQGWTPLHFAVYCNIEAVRLLVRHGADITIITPVGESALQACLRRHSPSVVHSILSEMDAFNNILLSDGSTKLLDLLKAMDNCDEFNKFSQKLPDINAVVCHDSPIWPGFNLLHLAISMHERILNVTNHFTSLCQPEMSPEQYTCSLDEEKIYSKRIVVCLVRQCSVTTRNAAGQTPVHLAFQLCKKSIIHRLLNCCKTNEADIESNLSFLHIACVTGKYDIVERFVKDMHMPLERDCVWSGYPYATRARAKSTALHIAVVCNQRQIIEYLLNNNADVYAQDSIGVTPIHLSLIYRPVADMILTKIGKVKEVVSTHGLSHLHIAAYADNEAAIDSLIEDGANLNAVLTTELLPQELGYLTTIAGQTPLHVADTHKSFRAIRRLVQAGADIHMGTLRSKYDTPLKRAAADEANEVMNVYAKKLRRDTRFTGPLEPSGLTLLHIACAINDFKWVKRLLERGADPNAQTCCKDDLPDETVRAVTPLHLLMFKLMHPNNRAKNLLELVKLMLKYGADVTIQASLGYTSLLLAASVAHVSRASSTYEGCDFVIEWKELLFEVADMMLKKQKSYAINPRTNANASHFHYACSRNNLEIVEKFMENGVDVNMPIYMLMSRFTAFTPLYFALDDDHYGEVACYLLEHGADATAEDMVGNTTLHRAAMSGVKSVKIFEMLASLGADVHAINFHNQTPVECFLMSSDISCEKVMFFANRGCKIDITKEHWNRGIIGLMLQNSSAEEAIELFKLLVDSFHLVEHIRKGFNAIQSFVGVDPNTKWKVEMYVESIQWLIDIGCDIDQQDKTGSTALNEAAANFNFVAVEALFRLGADVNTLKTVEQPTFCVRLVSEAVEDHDRQLLDTMTLIATHVYKLQCVGLEVNDSVKKIAEYAFKEHLVDKSTSARCKEEMKKLPYKKIGNIFTLQDFLSDEKAVIKYQLLTLEERQKIDKAFNVVSMHKDFPQLCGILMMQYRKAVKNVKLHWWARNAIVSLLQIELPDKCLKHIIKHLTNDELRKTA